MDQQAVSARKTRAVEIGAIKVGGGNPVVVQSMCATRTIDIDLTVAQAHQLADAGAGIVRIAMDSDKEIPAIKEIRAQTRGITLSVDLQENYRIADRVAPHVDKIRYNPGHLHHIEKKKTIEQKVKWLVESSTREHNVAIRIGVNCGSVAPAFLEKYPGDQLGAIVESGRVSLRPDGRAGLHALCRVAQGFRAAKSNRRQPPLRRAPSRRADSSRSDRGGTSARRHRRDPDRVREAARAGNRRDNSRVADAAQRAQARGSARRPQDYRRREGGPLHLGAGFRQGPQHHLVPSPARGSRTRNSSNWRSRSRC